MLAKTKELYLFSHTISILMLAFCFSTCDGGLALRFRMPSKWKWSSATAQQSSKHAYGEALRRNGEWSQHNNRTHGDDEKYYKRLTTTNTGNCRCVAAGVFSPTLLLLLIHELFESTFGGKEILQVTSKYEWLRIAAALSPYAVCARNVCNSLIKSQKHVKMMSQ